MSGKKFISGPFLFMTCINAIGSNSVAANDAAGTVYTLKCEKKTKN